MGSRGYGGVTSSLREFAASPLIAQYLALKEQYPEALLLARVGDFYEAYGEDAEDLARSLNIILTSKEAGKGKRVAMAGVPHHSVDAYLARLIRQRRVVAIADQMEQPVPNRLVRREIVRVLTPGTVLEDQFLQPERHNYLCTVARADGITALAAADVSTGEASVRALVNDDELAAEIDRFDPAEVVADLYRRLSASASRRDAPISLADATMRADAPKMATMRCFCPRAKSGPRSRSRWSCWSGTSPGSNSTGRRSRRARRRSRPRARC